MAEIEIGVLDRQCLDRHLPNRATILLTCNIYKFFCTFLDLTKRRKYYPQIKKIRKKNLFFSLQSS